MGYEEVGLELSGKAGSFSLLLSKPWCVRNVNTPPPWSPPCTHCAPLSTPSMPKATGSIYRSLRWLGHCFPTVSRPRDGFSLSAHACARVQPSSQSFGHVIGSSWVAVSTLSSMVVTVHAVYILWPKRLCVCGGVSYFGRRKCRKTKLHKNKKRGVCLLKVSSLRLEICMAQQVKVLGSRAEDLSPVPRTYWEERSYS